MSENRSEKGALKVAFRTFGCRSNYADTVDLAALVSERGGWVQEFEGEEDADVFVINSCTVTDTADREAIRLVEKLKSEKPDARIVFTGCMAEARPEVFREQFPEIAVLGPGQKKNVISAIMGDEGQVPRVSVPRNTGDTRLRKPAHKTISLDDPVPDALKGPGAQMGGFKLRSRFHLRVQEGCENHCTFCIIPGTRGVLSSRKNKDVLADLDALMGLGYREAVLSGTHLGGYGQDCGSSLLELLKQIEDCIGRAQARSGAHMRIRLSSLDPDDVSFEMIDFLSKSHFFCNHLHICLQAFTDATLKRMNRKYRLGDAKDLLWYVNERFTRCAVGSDVITGFPGESRKELEEGIETFLSLPISYLHVFPYSEREGTAATRLDGEVPVSERKRRSARWRAIAERRRVEFLETLPGEQLEVVVEDRVLDDGSVLGTSSEFATVRIVPSCVDSSEYRPASRVSSTDTYRAWTAPPPGALVRVRARMVEQEERRLVCELSDQEK
jgi:threonylcarbamoyladenosine tRNA methylthiotransferase MtaB